MTAAGRSQSVTARRCRRVRPLALAVGVTGIVAGCVGIRHGAAAPSRAAVAGRLPAAIADSVSTVSLAPGVWRHHLVRQVGPVRADVLDVDLAACVEVRAVKGAATAEGRLTTSALLAAVGRDGPAVAAVNADFFLFAPPGVPVGAHVEDGHVIAGPADRPVFTMDSGGRPWIGPLSVRGELRGSRASVALTHWNRPAASGAGVVDARWGVALDSAVAPTARWLVPAGAAPWRYVVRPAGDGLPLVARGDTLLLVGTESSGPTAPRDGDTVTVRVALDRSGLVHAVGGFPLLVVDSTILASVDSAGAASFRGPNPRTAVGIAARGRRLLFVTIDGRRPGHSVGATLRETAALLRDLGAHDALNLDGGGSTALAVADATAPAGVRVVNRPSDPAGERAVANAVAVLARCAR